MALRAADLVAKDGDRLVVLYWGGTKRKQQADIATALTLHAEYKARKRASMRTKKR